MSRQLGLELDPIMNPGGVQFPIKRGTWDFIEQDYHEGAAQSIIASIGSSYSTNTVYILYGCKISVGGGTYTISSGAIFFNGEYFICAGNSLPHIPGFVFVANLLSTSWQPTDAVGNQYADPVDFIGSSPANVHIIRTCNFANGLTGTGTISGTTASDFLSMVQVPYLINFPSQPANLNGLIVDFSTSKVYQPLSISSTNTITLSAGGTEGTEVLIILGCAGTEIIQFVGLGVICTVGGLPLTLSNAGFVEIRLKLISNDVGGGVLVEIFNPQSATVQQQLNTITSEVAYESWNVLPSIGTGWSSYNSPQYTKNGIKDVRLGGSIQTTSGSPSTTIATLPPTYRPSQLRLFTCPLLAPGSLNYIVIVSIDTSGVMTIIYPSGFSISSGCILYLDTINFPTL